jgi:hypothetical protein
MEQSKRFGTMLAEAMKNIARYQRRSMQAIQEEIAISLGVKVPMRFISGERKYS